MKGFIEDLEKLTEENNDFRRVLYTAHHLQLVLMALQPGEDIGEEVHEDRDQLFRIETGCGEIVIDDTVSSVRSEMAIVVPAGGPAQSSQHRNRAAAPLHRLRITPSIATAPCIKKKPM